MSKQRTIFISSVLLLVLIVFGLWYFDTRTSYNGSERTISKGVPLALRIFNKSEIDLETYNVVMSYEDNCMIMDMEGNILLKLPYELCIFTPDGKTFVSTGDIKVIDPHGDMLWNKSVGNHHWIEIDHANKIYYALSRRKVTHEGVGVNSEGVIGFNEKGDEVFRWEVHENLGLLRSIAGKVVDPKEVPKRRFEEPNFTHLNTVHVIQKNSLKHPAFKPGNLLLSCDYYTSLFIIDPKSKKVVWTYRAGEIDTGVHSPRMLPNGHILFFYNGYASKRSKLVEIDPISKEVVWEYSGFNFYSSGNGSVLRLENGNTLFVDIKIGGRVTEINADKKIVWQWVNPIHGPQSVSRNIYRVDRISKRDLNSYFKNSFN